MRAGEKLAVRLRAADPDGKVVRGSAVAAFYAPGKDPERVLADREPDREVPLVFDETTRTYRAEISSAGWQPGSWTLRGMVLDAAGAPAGWEYHRFPLDP